MSSIAERRNALFQMSRECGWFNTSLFLLDKFLTTLSKGRSRLYRYYFVAQPISNLALLPPGRGKKIEIRLIHEQEGFIQEFPRSAAVIQSRFRQGARCIAASKERRFVGFLWFQPGNYHYREDEVRACYMPLPPDRTAWDFDVYVAPEFRLSLAFPRLWEEANRVLKENGVLWSCSRISALNSGSLGAHAHFGTVSLGSAIFFCAGRWQITFASIPPYFHLSAHPDSYPEFRFNTEGLETEPRLPENNPET